MCVGVGRDGEPKPHQEEGKDMSFLPISPKKAMMGSPSPGEIWRGLAKSG